jgi:hypothetical protein
VEFTNLKSSGASIPGGATLDASGNGSFASGTTQAFGQGKRSDQVCVPGLGCGEVHSAEAGYTGTNSQPIDLGVDWKNHTCEVSGALLGALEGGNTTATARLTGTIVNEPPTANAGSPQTLECTSASGASITLDGSSSSDPENNIAFAVWHQGTRTGQEIGNDLKIQVNQGLGGSQTYFLRVVDADGQSSESSTAVTVVDTTPPAIGNLAATPNVLWPPDGKLVQVSVSVSASDTCGPNPACTIAQITSSEPITAADAQITGPLTANLAAKRLGSGTGRVYTLTVQCTDASGNTATATTKVTVLHDQGQP